MNTRILLFKIVTYLDGKLLRGLISKFYFLQILRESRRIFNEKFEYSIFLGQLGRPNELISLAQTYGTDKGSLARKGNLPWAAHSYTDLYSLLFAHCRNGVKAVLECGIGSNDPTIDGYFIENAKPGASLRMWKDFFPNAQIFGIDIDPKSLFQEERIVTRLVDQESRESILNFVSEIGDQKFDLIIDDGLHTFNAGCMLFENVFSILKSEGLYAIEDVTYENLIKFQLYFAERELEVFFTTLKRADRNIGDNSIVLIRKP